MHSLLAVFKCLLTTSFTLLVSDFGAVKLEVDLNRVTPVEADALEAAERKIEGENPLLEVGGIGAAAKVAQDV